MQTIHWKDIQYKGYVPQKGKFVSVKDSKSRAYVGCVYDLKEKGPLTQEQIKTCMHTLDKAPIWLHMAPDEKEFSLLGNALRKRTPSAHIINQWLDAKSGKWYIMFRPQDNMQGPLFCNHIEMNGIQGLGLTFETCPSINTNRITFHNVILCRKGLFPNTGILYALDLSDN